MTGIWHVVTHFEEFMFADPLRTLFEGIQDIRDNDSRLYRVQKGRCNFKVRDYVFKPAECVKSSPRVKKVLMLIGQYTYAGLE